MARKGWDSLSPDYRGRLERNGISKTAYEQGASIRGARGHAKTPERPTQQSGNFPQYQAERTRLSKRLIDKKYFWFSTSPKYNPSRSLRRMRDNPPAMKDLRLWLSFTREEWLDALRTDTHAAQYLGYH